MKKFTNPLDKVKIASPCGANWDAMYGDERRRFCSLCQLNVYNLSAMTQAEAESFLINSEGRVCLRIYRRKDGTVLMQDCPVGWQAIKRKVGHTATAVFALLAGFFNGVFAVESIKLINSIDFYKEIKENPKPIQKPNAVSFGLTDGILSNLPEIKIEILKGLRK